MTIGERLEEARKRKGISIREVSEATKIRGDYLMSMEDNTMEIPLPEIYRRGFLKNYAKYLKLDPDKLLTDYVAQQKGRALHRERTVAGEDRPVFGRMEIEEEEPAPAPVPPESGPATAREGASPDEPSRQEPPPRPAPILTDNTLYLKIAAGLMGTALVVLLVIVLVNLLRSGDEVADPVAGPATPAAVEETGPAGQGAAGAEAARSPTITLRATEDVTVIVDDVVTRERLFRGILRAGETQLIEREGAVNIKFSDGGALVIETGGETVRPSTAGMGQIQI